jgi:antibiotic biosynthesis monooxygenase (ABM) superfamily enzyme
VRVVTLNPFRYRPCEATVDSTPQWGDVVWAQIIKTRVKPGSEADLALLMDQFKAAEQADSGLIRSTTMRDQNDPDSTYIMVVFDREESARARESDPRREPGLAAARETMARIFEGTTEFVDLNVVMETVF